MPLKFKDKSGAEVVPAVRSNRKGGPLNAEMRAKRHRCYEMFLFGFSYEEIAKIEKMDHVRVMKWSSFDEWPRKRDAIKGLRKQKETKPENSPMIRALVEAGGGGKDEIIARVKKRKVNIADRVSEHVEKLTGEEIVDKAEKVSAAMKMVDNCVGLDKEEGGGRSLISLTFLTANPAESVRVIDVTPKPAIEEL